MIKKISAFLLSYILTFLSALIFISCIGYYVFVFDWNIPATSVAINAGVIILITAASIGIYGLAEKIKEII